jgi:hypothetical protein
VFAPAGIDGVHFDTDLERVGVQGAEAARLANALLASIRKDRGRG